MIQDRTRHRRDRHAGLLAGLLFASALAAPARPAAPDAAGGAYEALARCQNWVEAATARLERDLTTSDLERYRRTYLRGLPDGDTRPVAWGDLKTELGRARMVLVGDQHDLPESQAFAVRVLEAMSTGAGPITLAIEFIQARHQPLVESFLAGTLSEREFKRRAYDGSRWSYPWRHYRSILVAARTNRVRVVAVEPGPGVSLGERDRRVSAAVGGFQGRVMVFYGAYHVLGRGHLESRLGPDLVLTPVVDSRYWDLVRRHGTGSELIRLGPRVIFINQADALEQALPYLRLLMGGNDHETVEDLEEAHPELGRCPCTGDATP